MSGGWQVRQRGEMNPTLPASGGIAAAAVVTKVAVAGLSGTVTRVQFPVPAQVAQVQQVLQQHSNPGLWVMLFLFSALQLWLVMISCSYGSLGNLSFLLLSFLPF